MIKGFIFDLDGVLVDTPKLHFIAWRKVANSMGIDINESQNEYLKGLSRNESLKKILEMAGQRLSEEESEKLCAQKNEYYQEMLTNINESSSLPNVREFLKASKELHLKIALGSASQNARKILDQVKITDYFDVLIDGTQTTKSKPHPETFIMAANELGLAPHSLVVFEDSIAGIEAANLGGFRSVGIGKKKLLGQAERTYKGFEKLTPAGLINALNFKK